MEESSEIPVDDLFKGKLDDNTRSGFARFFERIREISKKVVGKTFKRLQKDKSGPRPPPPGKPDKKEEIVDISWETWDVHNRYKSDSPWYKEIHAFDSIAAITQGYINARLSKLFASAVKRKKTLGRTFGTSQLQQYDEDMTCLSSWKWTPTGGDSTVSVTFKQPKMQLFVKEGRCYVVLFLHLDKGRMTHQQMSGNGYTGYRQQ